LTQKIVVVIPKTVHKLRIIENFNIFDKRLSSDNIKAFKKLDKKISSFFGHRHSEIVKYSGSYKLPENN